MADLAADDFAVFMEAVTGFAPFPWQRRLTGQVLERGWPALLDLPTGTGKTNSLLIALFAHALEPARFARRVALVVDRRIIVDQVARFGEQIQRALSDPAAAPIVREVRGRLLESAGDPDGDPLRVVQLRGGVPRDDSWITSPLQPMFIASTVDQVGSRLLFRGYGVSPGMRPIHAGLLSHDTLLLLDEVHLSTAFEETLTALQRRYGTWAEQPLAAGLEVVRLSATARSNHIADAERFALDAEDREHEVLRIRLSAQRPAVLVEVQTRTLKQERSARQAVAAAAKKRVDQELAGGSASIAVIVNRVETARITADLLRREDEIEADVVLITGRMRPLDRGEVDRQVNNRVAAGVSPDENARPVVVVATQCLEVGADYDFDALVTECASLDALRQRFGRLNRLGGKPSPRGCVLMRADQAQDKADPDPIYGNALRETWKYLQEASRDGQVDFGLLAFPEPEDTGPLRSPSTESPLLFPSYLDAWAQTRPSPHPDPDISLWLHGKNTSPSADVQLVFRAGLDADGASNGVPGPTSHACVNDLLDWVPPCSIEAVTLPLHEVRRWLRGEAAALHVADVEGGPQDSDRLREQPAETGRGIWRWSADGAEWIFAEDIRPGDTLIAPAERGGLAHGSWSPEATELISDLGELANFVARGRVQLRLTNEALPTEARTTAIPKPPESEEEDLEESRATCLAWIAQTAMRTDLPEHWANIFSALAAEGRKINLRSVERIDGGAIWLAGLRQQTDVRGATSEASVSSFTGREVTLRDHGDDASAWAHAFVSGTQLTAEQRSDVTLAAWLHDIGKAHPRFQALLCGGDPIRAAARLEPLAKSALPSSADRRQRASDRAKWPAGLRHELFSLRLFDASPELQARTHDVDLVRHLISSHHGWCRPWPPAVFDDVPTPVTFDPGEIRTSISSDALGPSVSGEAAERFARLNDRYGWHGVAYLEALLRLADHNASAGPGSRPFLAPAPAAGQTNR